MSLKTLILTPWLVAPRRFHGGVLGTNWTGGALVFARVIVTRHRNFLLHVLRSFERALGLLDGHRDCWNISRLRLLSLGTTEYGPSLGRC